MDKPLMTLDSQESFSSVLSWLSRWFTIFTGEGSAKTLHSTADHTWDLQPDPLSSTAMGLITPEDTCKHKKQICIAYPIRDDSLPLTDVPR